MLTVPTHGSPPFGSCITMLPNILPEASQSWQPALQNDMRLHGELTQALAYACDSNDIIGSPGRKAAGRGRHAHNTVCAQSRDATLDGSHIRDQLVPAQHHWHHHSLKAGRGDGLEAGLLVDAWPDHMASMGAWAVQRLQGQQGQGHGHASRHG